MKKIIPLLILCVVYISAKSQNNQLLNKDNKGYAGLMYDLNLNNNLSSLNVSLGVGGEDGGVFVKGGVVQQDFKKISTILNMGLLICPVNSNNVSYYIDFGIFNDVQENKIKSSFSGGLILYVLGSHISIGTSVYDCKYINISYGVYIY